MSKKPLTSPTIPAIGEGKRGEQGHIGYLLRQASAAHRIRMEQALRDTGVKPEYIESVAYDPALLVVAALRALGPNASGGKIRDYLNGIGTFAGATGRYNFKTTPQRGLDASQIFVARWDGSKNAWVAVSKAGGDPR